MNSTLDMLRVLKLLGKVDDVLLQEAGVLSRDLFSLIHQFTLDFFNVDLKKGTSGQKIQTARKLSSEAANRARSHSIEERMRLEAEKKKNEAEKKRIEEEKKKIEEKKAEEGFPYEEISHFFRGKTKSIRGGKEEVRSRKEEDRAGKERIRGPRAREKEERR